LANHKSAIKRAKQNISRRIRNQSSKTRIKNLVKQIRLASEEKSKEVASNLLGSAQSVIDRGVKKGVIHRKTGSRKLSRLTKLVNSISS